MSSFGSATPEPTAYTDAANEEPKPIQGYLLKQSPNRFRQCGLGLQTRFVTVRAGRVYWSHHSACTPSGVPSSPQGYIDLVVNECDVVDEDDSRFALCPKGGHWSDGSFTGHKVGRVFQFDASQSNRSKAEWLDAVTNHVNYASAVRGSLLRPRGHSGSSPGRHVTFSDEPADVCDSDGTDAADLDAAAPKSSKGLKRCANRSGTAYVHGTGGGGAVKFAGEPEVLEAASPAVAGAGKRSQKRAGTAFVHGAAAEEEDEEEEGDRGGSTVKFADEPEVLGAAPEDTGAPGKKRSQKRAGTAFVRDAPSEEEDDEEAGDRGGSTVKFADEPEVLGAAPEDAGAPGKKRSQKRAGTGFVRDAPADDEDDYSRGSISSEAGDRVVKLWTEDARSQTSSTGGT